MAEEIQKKKISELPSAVYLSDEDVMPVVQGSGSSEATKKADIGLVGSTVAESKTFSNLDTTSKTLVGAINEVNSSLGNVPSADEISYDNTSSGLSASDVQGAIDEIAQGGSGGSTVTVTQIQATGTKIATITVDSVDTDLYAPQGGGSGGHTILDDEGTSLTQRDDLQFKGAYSEDDSTNDKTVVNVARTMTLAEFEQLTDDEKAGFINVKDETSGSDDKFQPVIYSEEEREIGVWIDGKPLYEKTIDFGALPNTTTKSVNHNISNIDKVAFLNGVAYKLGDIIPIPFSHSSNVSNQPQLSIGDTTVNIRTANDQSDRTGYITVRYTKSTDQAGSGQWTPQGVPAVHYSEDEQIVGTWIDGSTLYERTLTTPTTSTTTASGISSVFSLSGVENVEIVGGYVYIGTATLPLNFVMYEVDYSVFTFYDIANAQIANNIIGWTPTAFNIRVRYTKSST